MRLFKKKNTGTVKVVPNQDVLHQGERFVKGETYDVPTSLATYFGRMGWLEGTDVSPPSEVTLTIDNAKHTHEGDTIG